MDTPTTTYMDICNIIKMYGRIDWIGLPSFDPDKLVDLRPPIIQLQLTGGHVEQKKSHLYEKGGNYKGQIC